MVILKKTQVDYNAIFSEDNMHRFLLSRIWDIEKKKATAIMLNPSYADHLKNDLTVLKVTNCLIDQGFGTLSIVNLFSFIATDPKELSNNKDTIRSDTNEYIVNAIKGADLIIIGWGSDSHKYISRKGELKVILEKFQIKLKCFRDSENKMGRHPSRLGNDLELIDFIW
jgi:hypothetical protein